MVRLCRSTSLGIISLHWKGGDETMGDKKPAKTKKSKEKAKGVKGGAATPTEQPAEQKVKK